MGRCSKPSQSGEQGVEIRASWPGVSVSRSLTASAGGEGVASVRSMLPLQLSWTRGRRRDGEKNAPTALFGCVGEKYAPTSAALD
jgi:hypothetical protein